MTVGEVVSALIMRASGFDKDYLFMERCIDGISVGRDTIRVYFNDGQIPDITIGKEGKLVKRANHCKQMPDDEEDEYK